MAQIAPSPIVEWPKPTGEREVDATIRVLDHFDGHMQRFYGVDDLGTSSQDENQDPMFRLSDGAVLENVIIGDPAADGVHCYGSCTLKNVWWERVGEDAATFRGQQPDDVMIVDKGGASGAKDKVFQNNGVGTMIVKNFYVENFGKLYRSCGNCSRQSARTIVLTYGQRLEVKNLSAPATQKIYAPDFENAPGYALMIAPPGADAVKLYPKSIGRYRLVDKMKNDWMEADVYVIGHPLHTVSNTAGHFRLDGVPVVASLVDQPAAMVGQACVARGDVKCTYGTGCFVYRNTGGHVARSTNGLLSTVAWRRDGKSTYALEGGVFAAGSMIGWLCDALGLASSASDLDELAASVPDSSGVACVPAFQGLGAPHWDASSRRETR